MQALLTTRQLPAHSGQVPRDNPQTAKQAFKCFFKHTSSMVLITAIIGFTGYRLYLGNFGGADLLIAAIIFAGWPVLEWLIHVVLLHNKPRKLLGREIDFLLPQTHRWHHSDPWNLKWVFIPLHVYPIVGPLLIVGAFLLLPTPALACTTLAVYFALALHYEWVHYLAHIGWCPPLSYYQRRVREHRLHHFRNEQKWWGVSMGLGDRLFGTAPAATDVDPTGNTSDIMGNHKNG